MKKSVVYKKTCCTTSDTWNVKLYGILDLIWQYATRNPCILICCQEAHSAPSQISKMVLFARIIDDFELLTTFAKSSILNAWLGYEMINCFLRNGWPTKWLYALFPAGTISKDTRYRQCPTHREQGLNLQRIWA